MRSVLALVVLGALAGCSSEHAPPAPGHSGDVPSPAAQRALRALGGERLPGAGAALGAKGELVIESFAVVPNPVSGKGPVLALHVEGGSPGPHRFDAAQGQDGRWWLPVHTDADVADLVRRVTGERPADLPAEPLSGPYRAALRIAAGD